MSGFIYRMTFPSGKKYVGQTTTTIEKRHYEYKNCKCNRQPKLYNALNKYGYESCEVEEFEIPASDLSLVEILIIAQEDSFENGYNGTVGGEGGLYTPTAELKYGIRPSDPDYKRVCYQAKSEEQKEKARAKSRAYGEKKKAMLSYYGMNVYQWYHYFSKEDRAVMRAVYDECIGDC